MLPSGAGTSGDTKPPRTRLRPPIGWYGIGSTSPIFEASQAAYSTAPRGRNGRQSSMNSGALPVRLRQEDQQHVDVLARVVDDRQEAGRAGRVGVLRVPAQVEGPLARELEAPVIDLALDRVRVGDPVVLGAVLPARRDLPEQLHRLALLRALISQMPSSLIMNNDVAWALSALLAARPVTCRNGVPSSFPPSGLSIGPSCMTAPVGPVEAIRIASSSGVSGDGVVGALVRHLAGFERHALRHAAGAPVLEAGGDRVGEEVPEPGVLGGRLRCGHALCRSSSARAIGNTSRSASLPSQQSRCA